jgi:DNA-binding GntR family transcriptional regulator
MTNLSELKHTGKSLGEQAHEAIRDSVITLRLVPGEMVYENQLAATYGISRTPVREAIRKLAVEELIDVLPQRGTRIAHISERKLKDAAFVRSSLEMSAFRSVAKEWSETSESCRRLKQQVQLNLAEQHKAQNNPKVFLQLDEAFHRLILQQLGNDTLLNVVLQMRGHLNRIRYLALEQLHDMERLVNEHEALFAAVTRNDDIAVAQILSGHLNKMHNDLPALKQRFADYFKP